MPQLKDPMSRVELRKFGLVTAGMFLLFFELLFPWLWNMEWPVWPLFLAATLVVVALIIPVALGPVYKVWMQVAEVLGWINTRIILSAIFYLIFLPFGLIMRLFNDPMRRKLDDDTESYRIASNQPDQKNMERPF